jgi:hypothetical protein
MRKNTIRDESLEEIVEEEREGVAHSLHVEAHRAFLRGLMVYSNRTRSYGCNNSMLVLWRVAPIVETLGASDDRERS